MSEQIDNYILKQQKTAWEKTKAIRKAHLERNYQYLIPGTISGYLDAIKFTPQKPNIKSLTKTSNHDEGITLTKKIKALFRDDTKAELQEKKEIAKTKAEINYKCAMQKYNGQIIEENQRLIEIRQSLFAHQKHVTEDYFTFCLYQDKIPNTGIENFEFRFNDLNYTPEEKSLSFSYRLPEKEDIEPISKYEFNKEQNRITYSLLEDEYAIRYYRDEIQALIFRAISIIFLSDECKSIETINVLGYFEYYDPSYGTNQIKKVMSIQVSSEEFEKVDITKVKIDQFLTNHTTIHISNNLYDMKAYEIEAIKI